MFVRGEFPNFRHLYVNYTEEKENSRLFEIDANCSACSNFVFRHKKVSSRKYIIQRKQLLRLFFFFSIQKLLEKENYLTHSISLEVSIHFPRNLYNTILPNVKEDFTILRLRLAQEFFKKFPSTRTTEI